ncbi:MAG: DUF4156 domain-containing protein [Gammaproteobacteria bacterium]
MNIAKSRLTPRFIIAPIAMVFLASCTWVSLTTAGEGVRVAQASEVNGCQRLGNATAQTRSRVTVVDRSNERVQQELTILARNEAGRMGGNTIVPDSVIEGGGQNFSVYNCP